MARFRHAASAVALLVALSTSADARAQSVQTDYTYDVHGRLTGVSRPGSTTTYTYDNAQNRTRVVTTKTNSPPVAYADTLTVTAGASASINPLSNDTDPDSDPIILT
uniref:Ig-like domain-containing protein n=1 Tax=Caulobacter sp. SSI4214 TaxID=2575739 RepID=UPI00143CB2C6